MSTTEQEALYNKIRGLLRKAERTDNEHEASAFYNKAQQLIMRYAVDEEKMWANDPEKKSKIETLNIAIADRAAGAQEKRRILHACAKANRCRMWYTPGMDRSTIAGYKSDLLFTEMLFSSVITQMNFRVAFAIAMNSHVHPKTFRSSFYIGFATRVWDRFLEMDRKNTEQTKNENPGSELVLADRKAKVDAWVAENVKLGKDRSAGKKKINYEAVVAGKDAANKTDLSGGKGQVRSTQKGIGR